MICPESLPLALHVLCFLSKIEKNNSFMHSLVTELQGGGGQIVGISTRLEDPNFSNTGSGRTCDPQKRAESVNRFRIKRNNRCYDKKVAFDACSV